MKWLNKILHLFRGRKTKFKGFRIWKCNVPCVRGDEMKIIEFYVEFDKPILDRYEVKEIIESSQTEPNFEDWKPIMWNVFVYDKKPKSIIYPLK